MHRQVRLHHEHEDCLGVATQKKSNDQSLKYSLVEHLHRLGNAMLEEHVYNGRVIISAFE